MATLSPASRRRLISLGGALVLTALIYLANAVTPSTIKLGLLYLIPVLLVTWFEGVFWGAAVTLATAVLRLVIEIDQVPQDTTSVAVLNQLSFLAVAGIAIFGFRHIRRTQTLLEDLAIRDPLTLVYNARAFAERLGQELKRTRRYGRPLSVLYLDLDDFKRVNDSHGHQTGDAVLKLVADAIRRAVRQLDVVGRLGGDEFAVLMPETDGDLAAAAAARLAKELRDAFKGTPAVTASVGVVSCTRAEAGVDEVLRQADQAMYQAKRKGKDQAVKVAM
ncbi:MAG TPA: GGDEF domain-containing protein [Gemmatimonadales bacterium]|nr:GGDEF domain-containing protein [Gemmatimonadales bacterium]